MWVVVFDPQSHSEKLGNMPIIPLLSILFLKIQKYKELARSPCNGNHFTRNLVLVLPTKVVS